MNIDSNSFLQDVSEGILALDADGYISYANPAVTLITGYSPTELQNKHLSILYNGPDDSIKAEYELALALKKGKFVSEGWRTTKEGKQFWGEMTLAPLYGHQEESNGFSCVVRDVTEKKKEEIEVRQNADRIRLMVEAVRDYAIFLLDTTGHIITWNEGARRIKGYSANEIIGKHFSTFYTAEDLEDKKPERELRIATATGKYEEEGWRVRKNGSVFWANVVITALFNEQNKLVGFSKVTRDLSERKGIEENLRANEERYRSLVEQVRDYGIFMLDESGRIISWNEGAKRIEGYEADEIIGKYFSIFYPEDDVLNGKPSYELKIARSEGKYEEEGWRVHKNGSQFWANVVITPIYNTAGILIGFSKVTRDLTERQEAERALRESYERYRVLAEELRATNHELSYANEELEQFTSIVSHDLQEPIRTVKSFLQLIHMKLNAQQAEDLKTYIDKAIHAADRMRELIRNLLHYSQLSKGEMIEERVGVKELVNAAVQNLKTSIERANAVITLESKIEAVEGDRVQLVQLVQNLISNAMKFTTADQPQIQISCYEEKGYVKFAVSDNGIGIAETDKNKVFEIFRRLHTKKDYPGTGIGLAICKKIVDRHRGKIWPESNPGKGTTFYFTLNEEKEKEPA
ncbi:PAS domain S-box protein [Flavisolibacter ginsenosidimutans]|uniref:histidine kinase n=1 Tax=Flavisolibacter ginsenosidimutans TaxID=661481 RepID=A0A5B8UN14_9BACT|nr:PAS domain S-box protein [Flavisolibacter ginsenosidimutans]QEC58067.1 PAS domain S-box protein [Flavisolibacter ginsenosidimutans]